MTGIRVGVAGWAYRDWEGIVYPSDRPPGFDPLRFLARHLDCVEVNSTFYRIPSADVAKRWAEIVAESARFRFTAKLWEGFTHAAAASWTDADVHAFRAAVEPLRSANRLGAIVVQFPWHFERHAANERRVEDIALAFGELPLVLEVRHVSWVEPDALERIASVGYSLCNIDLPLARTSIHPGARVTGPIGYARLHGRNYAAWFSRTATRDQKYDYLYSDAEEDEWVERTRRLAAQTRETYLVANNHFRGQAVANALSLRAKLEGGPVEVPPSLLDAFERLRKIAAPPRADLPAADAVPARRATKRRRAAPEERGLFDDA